MKFRNPFSPPSALVLAARQLEETRRDHLAASAWREHFVAQERMLRARTERLESEVARLSSLPLTPESDHA